MQPTIEIVLKANTSMSLQKKMVWYSKVYPQSEYETKFGIPFSTKDGMSAVKVTRLNK